MWVQSDLKCGTKWVFKWQQRSVCKVRHVTPQFADPQVLRKLEPGIGQELLPPHLLNNQMLLNNCVYKPRSRGVVDYPESTLWGKSAAAADVIEEEVTSTVENHCCTLSTPP